MDFVRRDRNRSFIIQLVVIVTILIWWFFPIKIVSFQPSDVSKIHIMDRTHGDEVTITDSDEINHIITNLNAVSVRKSGLALGFGLSFDVTIYDHSGNTLSTFIIQSDNKIKKGILFYSVYQDDGLHIDQDFFEDIFERYGTPCH